MDKSEGSGVCDFQDKDCGDGFSKKEEGDSKKDSKKAEVKKEEPKKEVKQKQSALSQETSSKKYVKVDASQTGSTTGVPILDSVAANDLRAKEE